MNEPFADDPIIPAGSPDASAPPSAAPDGTLLPAPPRGRLFSVALILGIVAWCVIVVCVLAIVVPRQVEESAQDAAANDALHLLTMRLQARYLVGIRALLGPALANDSQIGMQVQALDTGPISQRLRQVVLVGEMNGPPAALKQLDKLETMARAQGQSFSPEQTAQRDILRKLYNDYSRLRYSAPSVDDQERQDLQDGLDWFGDLALAPAGQPGIADEVAAVAGGPAAAGMHVDNPDSQARRNVLRPAQRAVVTIFGAFGMGIFILLAGFFGLIIVGVLFFMGKLRGGLRCGVSPAGVYAETFALWMLMFEVIGLVFREVPLGSFRLLIGGGVELLTLSVLAWPVLRGLPWRQVREDLGLTLGRRHVAEPVIGLGCYVLGSPLVFTGLLVTLLLTLVQHLLTDSPPPEQMFVNPPTPSHPLIVPLARGDWNIRLQFFFLASFVAPVVEEILFRGVLYRHLRELTHRWGAMVSVIGSGLISSFIFAVIHPQGLLVVPVLMSLACSFVLMREWRITLLPSILAHGFSNGLVLLLNIAMLSD